MGKIQEELSKASREGKNQDFIGNPDNQKLYCELLALYDMAESFLPSIKFIRFLGTKTCREIGCMIRKEMESLGGYALEGRYRKFKPFLPHVNVEKLMFEREGKLTYNKEEDMKFWEKATQTISLNIDGIPSTVYMLDIYDAIAVIEKRLRLKSVYKKRFTFRPIGKVLFEGTFTYENGKEMRKIGARLKKEKVKINILTGTIQCGTKKISPKIKTETAVLSLKLTATIPSSSVRNLYGLCKFEIIAYPEGNSIYLYITNLKGRVTCPMYFEARVTNMPEFYIESDMSEHFNKIFEGVKPIRIYSSIEISKSGLVNSGNHSLEVSTNNIKRQPEAGSNAFQSKKKSLISLTTKDKVVPTVLANHNTPSLKSMLSLGERPNAGVLEIVSTSDKGSSFDLSNPFWLLLTQSPFITRKFEGYNPIDTAVVEKVVKNRKICNPNLDTILKAVRSMKSGQKLKARAFMPVEKFRLMGFPKKYIKKILQLKTSKTQLYHIAGNSIAVPVLYHIFENMIIPSGLRKQNSYPWRA